MDRNKHQNKLTANQTVFENRLLSSKVASVYFQLLTYHS